MTKPHGSKAAAARLFVLDIGRGIKMVAKYPVRKSQITLAPCGIIHPIGSSKHEWLRR